MAIITSELAKLQYHTTEEFVTRKTQDNIIKALALQVSANTKEIHAMARSWPEQLWDTLLLQSHIKESGTFLNKAINSWKNGIIVPELGSFLKIKDLENVDVLSSAAQACKLIQPGMIRLYFTTRAIDHKSIILSADPFRTYVNLTREPCLVEYIGERYLMYNLTSNCTLPLNNLPVSRYHVASCSNTNQGFRNPSPMWGRVVCVKDIKPHSSDRGCKDHQISRTHLLYQ